jgi:uncharacterized protein (DUF58 family)
MTQMRPLPEEMRSASARPPLASGPGQEPRSTYQRLMRELRRGRYVDVSKDTQFSEAWLLLAALVTLLGLAFRIPFMLAVAAGLILIAAATWTWNELSLFGLHYQRSFSETRAFLGETVELSLEVRNRKFLPLTWLEIVDSFAGPLPVDGVPIMLDATTNLGEFNTFWSLGAFQRITRHYQVQCIQRGFHTYGPARIKTGDGFGLFGRQATLPLQQRLIVYPRLYSAADLRLPAKTPFGERIRRERLFEDPLRTAGIREWQPGDNLRRVHWKATARHQEMLSRQYEASEEPQVLIILNVATLHRHWLGSIPELQERAISVAGSLAQLATELRLPVGLIANGYLPGSDQALRLLPGRSPDQLVHILELLAAVTPFAVAPIEEMLVHEAPRLPWGATLVVVTAIAHDDLLAALWELAHAGRKLVLFTLAEEPPAMPLPGITIYHLPHLVDDLIAPQEVSV